MGRREVKKVVLASGTFDLIHYGHVRYLEAAKKAGGKDAELVVVVARDNTVKRRKGKKPVMSEQQRRSLVAALRVVDKAILGFEGFDMIRMLERIKPDVIAVGHDQGDLEDDVKRTLNQRGITVKVVRVARFGEDELNSSSSIKKEIIESFEKQ
ncbi:MAG: FAD synthase [Candidatus Bathyarchaeota archaeon]|nr:MAG: FAD synthase [Candidatus Bathyarchaeota archaeon]